MFHYHLRSDDTFRETAAAKCLHDIQQHTKIQKNHKINAFLLKYMRSNVYNRNPLFPMTRKQNIHIHDSE